MLNDWDRDRIRRQISLVKSISSNRSPSSDHHQTTSSMLCDEVSNQEVDKTCSIAQILARQKKRTTTADGGGESPRSSPYHQSNSAAAVVTPLSRTPRTPRSTTTTTTTTPNTTQYQQESWASEPKFRTKIPLSIQQEKNQSSPRRNVSSLVSPRYMPQQHHQQSQQQRTVNYNTSSPRNSNHTNHATPTTVSSPRVAVQHDGGGTKEDIDSPSARFKHVGDDILRSLEQERQRLYEEYLSLEVEFTKQSLKEKKKALKKQRKEGVKKEDGNVDLTKPQSSSIAESLLSPRYQKRSSEAIRSETSASRKEKDQKSTPLAPRSKKTTSTPRTPQSTGKTPTDGASPIASSTPFSSPPKNEKEVDRTPAVDKKDDVVVTNPTSTPVDESVKKKVPIPKYVPSEKDPLDEAFKSLTDSLLSTSASHSPPPPSAVSAQAPQQSSSIMSQYTASQLKHARKPEQTSPKVQEDQRVKEVLSFSSISPSVKGGVPQSPRYVTVADKYISSLNEIMGLSQKKRQTVTPQQANNIVERLMNSKSSPQKVESPNYTPTLSKGTQELFKDDSYDFMKSQTQFLEAKKANIERLREKRLEEEENEIQKAKSATTINRTSKSINSRINHLLSWHTSTMEKRKVMQERLIEEEMRECAFKPLLSPRTNRMMSNSNNTSINK